MQWSEVRERFPEQWVLIEAVKARSEGGQRILEDIAVLESFDDGLEAQRHYLAVHRAHPERELLFVSTRRAQLDIEEVQAPIVRSYG